jgi:hypothetical protein
VKYAKLDGRSVKEVKTMDELAEVYGRNNNRHIGDDEKDGVRVSTVFLGIDHGFGDRPLWFETMIFGGPHDEYQERYETYEQAEEGHKRALELAYSTAESGDKE